MKGFPFRKVNPADGLTGLITILWSDEGISLAGWAPRAGNRLLLQGTAFLEADCCDATGYRNQLAQLQAGFGASRFSVQWICFEEGLARGALEDGPGGCLSGFPEWMPACWQGLDAKELPVRMVSATACMEAELRKWPEFCESGTGVFLAAGRRSLFFAYSGEFVFRRLSRREDRTAGEDELPGPDWIQQTRMLYRNRTGAELKRILVPGREGGGRDVMGVEVCAGMLPPAWVTRGTAEMEPGLVYLHASVARSGDSPECGRRVDVVERKVRRHRHEAGFRVAACLLLGTWMLGLLGACRGQPDDSSGRRPWEEAAREWRGLESGWRSLAEHQQREAAPYRLVGRLAETVPEGVAVNRIRLERKGDREGRDLRLYLEGTYAGEHASGIFHDWMDLLKAESPLGEVENLRFERKGKQIAFHLEGTTREKGILP